MKQTIRALAVSLVAILLCIFLFLLVPREQAPVVEEIPDHLRKLPAIASAARRHQHAGQSQDTIMNVEAPTDVENEKASRKTLPEGRKRPTREIARDDWRGRRLLF